MKLKEKFAEEWTTGFDFDERAAFIAGFELAREIAVSCIADRTYHVATIGSDINQAVEDLRKLGEEEVK